MGWRRSCHPVVLLDEVFGSQDREPHRALLGRLRALGEPKPVRPDCVLRR
jgi:hypothetical protein